MASSEFDNSWKTKVHVPLFDKILELNIVTDEGKSLGKKEHALWRQFIDNQAQLKPVLEKIIFDYYNRHLEDLRMPYSPEEEEEFAPTLKQPSEVWSIIKPLHLALDVDEDNITMLYIEFWAKWDEEHGLDIVFRGKQIGIADAGAHWLDHDRYNLKGKLLHLGDEN